MPHRAGHIHRRACACRKEVVISTGGPMHAARSRSYPPEGLCMPQRAGHIHRRACACRKELVISTGGPMHAAKSRS